MKVTSSEHGKGIVIKADGPLAVLAHFTPVHRVTRVRVGQSKWHHSRKAKTFTGGAHSVPTKEGSRAQREMTRFIRKFYPKHPPSTYLTDIEIVTRVTSAAECNGGCGRIFIGERAPELFTCDRCASLRRISPALQQVIGDAPSPDTKGWKRVQLQLKRLSATEQKDMVKLHRRIQRTVAESPFTSEEKLALQPPHPSLLMNVRDSSRLVSAATGRTVTTQSDLVIEDVDAEFFQRDKLREDIELPTDPESAAQPFLDPWHVYDAAPPRQTMESRNLTAKQFAVLAPQTSGAGRSALFEVVVRGRRAADVAAEFGVSAKYLTETASRMRRKNRNL